MEENQRRFYSHVDKFEGKFVGQLNSFEAIVTMAQSMTSISNDVSNNDWQAFSSGIRWSGFHGILAISYAERVRRNDLAAFSDRAKLLGADNFEIKTLSNSTSAEAYVIRLIGPDAADADALGLDLAADASNRKILEWAMLNGRITASTGSAPIFFMQPKSSMLLVMAVYHRHSAPLTIEDRRATTKGWVLMSINLGLEAATVLTEIRDQLDVDIYLGGAVQSNNILFTSRNLDGPTEVRSRASSEEQLRLSRTIVFAGQSLTFSYQNRPVAVGFFAATSNLIAIGGGSFSIFIGILVWLLITGRERAESLAHEMTIDLRAARETAERFASDMEMSRASLEALAGQTVELAEDLANQQAETEAARQQSEYLANHDILTGLPNRRAFQETLKSFVGKFCDDGNNAIALLFIDLDKFKQVNDVLGHAAGDELLVKVSAQLSGILRGSDYVARLGGDEFAFLLVDKRKTIRKSAASVGARILSQLQIPIPSPKGTIEVGCTVGVAVAPMDAPDAPSLIAFSDALMYEGKRLGRNRVVSSAEVSGQSTKQI